MGGTFSSPSSSTNPSDSGGASPPIHPISSPFPEPQALESQHPPQIPDSPTGRQNARGESDKSEAVAGSGIGDQKSKEEEEEEELGECPFCVFMKEGGCKESFIAWENCVDEAEEKDEDVAEKCFETTAALNKCMEAHFDYYEPILKVKEAAEEAAAKESEKANTSEKKSEAQILR